MANSKKPKKPLQNKSTPHTAAAHGLFIQLQQDLTQLFTQRALAHPRVLLALSGGLDSAVLLHLLASLRDNLPMHLSAMHVHHGLSPNADAWAQRCAQMCDRLNVPMQLVHVYVDKARGLGVEAAAREARYRALMGADSDVICLAHHQDDQAETVLLQLARGSGLRGLSAMARVDAARRIVRPLLSCRRADLSAYAQLYQLDWVEDESNEDARFDRNFIRHGVMPVLRERYPSIDETLSRAASHFAEASALLDEVATADAERMIKQDALDLTALAVLSKPRQANLLRWWLRDHDIEMPSSAQLQQVLTQLLTARPDAQPQLKLNAVYTLMRYQQHAYLVQNKQPIMIHQQWQGEENTTLPDGSRLLVTKQLGQGLAARHTASLEIKTRMGGEHIRLQANRPLRTLKQVFQEHHIPPWQRKRLPLIYLEGQLVAIPNVGISVDMRANPQEIGMQFYWQSE